MSLFKSTSISGAAAEDQKSIAASADPISLTSSRIERAPSIAPPKRELRSQAFHRLQVGLVGLVVTLMIVGLANIIMDRALLAEARVDPAAQAAPSPATDAAAAEAGASEPLSDIGVVPDLPPADTAATPSPAP